MSSPDLEFPKISREVWQRKYRFVAPARTHGSATAIVAPSDATPDDTMRRVADAAASVEKGGKRKQRQWSDTFQGALSDFGFLPAGRILAGAGTNRDVTLFNCFVLGTIPDDLSGIFDALKDAAMSMQAGGGIGHDFSTLRPRGALVRSIAAEAAGPLHFMDVWNTMCGTIQSAGQRRGAMMATLRCDHPDIEAFVAAKADPARLRNFNLSVLVTDAFVDAVRADRDWPLVFAGETVRTLRARALWDSIMRATYDYAEPGVIFIDRVNAANNLNYCEKISATNPCGEQPLPPYGACLLGSINLARLIENRFEADATLDRAALSRRVAIAVRLLDNLVDVSRYPLDQQRDEAVAKRRIGLGITGLADALIFCGLGYGTERGRRRAQEWMEDIQNAAYLASANLAREKGPYPLYDRDGILKSENVRRLRPDVIETIAAHGLRNGCLTSIAPTGTISLLAGNVSSGLEPVFDWTFERQLRDADGGSHVEQIDDYAYRAFRHQGGAHAALPTAFVTAGDLKPADHLAMQAALQPFVDSAISKTINCPEDMSFDAFQNIYLDAFDQGLKGCTTYRPNPVTGAVLSKPAPDRRDAPAHAQPPVSSDGRIDTAADLPARDAELDGTTYKIKWPDSPHALYVTINDSVHDGQRRPFEIFINTKSLEHYAWTVALTRMISAVFRRGGNVAFVAEELQAVFDPEGGRWMDGRYVPSLMAAIGNVIEQHMRKVGFVNDGADAGQKPSATALPTARFCPACGNRSLERIAGCWTCQSCLYTKCG